jgi:hypothetical protein
LGQGFYANRFVIGKGVVLCFDTGVIDERPGVGDETRHGGTNVGIDFGNLFNRGWIQQWTAETLFYGQDTAILGLESDCSGAKLDRFDRVFDLNSHINDNHDIRKC